MSYTVNYLQSESVAAQGVEVIVLVNCLVQDAIRLGASPRAALGLVAAARAHAVIAGRRFVLPDDVKAVAVSVLAHRLVTDTASVGTFDAGIAAMQAILERVPAPRP